MAVDACQIIDLTASSVKEPMPSGQWGARLCHVGIRDEPNLRAGVSLRNSLIPVTFVCGVTGGRRIEGAEDNCSMGCTTSWEMTNTQRMLYTPNTGLGALR